MLTYSNESRTVFASWFRENPPQLSVTFALVCEAFWSNVIGNVLI